MDRCDLDFSLELTVEIAVGVGNCKPILGTWLSWVVQDITWPLNTASVP